MKKLTLVAILIYMFCVLYGCAPIYTENFETEAWKDYLMEKERLLDIAPTFLEVNGKKIMVKNMKERTNWPRKGPYSTFIICPY